MIFIMVVYIGYPVIADWFLHGFGMNWSPTTGQFGIIRYLYSTLYVGIGATVIATVLGLPCAIYLAEFADRKLRNVVKPSLEALTGFPSVIIGLIGFALITEIIRVSFGDGIGVLAAWIILGIMSLPHVASISEDSIRTVPHELREASLALGATRWQTMLKVLIPVARPGIIAAIVLAMGSAVGETMAVIMVIGGVTNPQITLNPIVHSNVMTTVIATDYAEIAWGSTQWQALYGIAFMLFLMVGILDIAITKAIKRSVQK
jgi:phosphate transport system permease protein